METIDVSSLPINDGNVVLDLGCGEGRHSIAVAYHFPKALTIGLDISLADLIKADEKSQGFLEENAKAHYIHSSGFSLPFADSSVDHIICSEVLEHIVDYEPFIDEISRVLKKDGSLNISIPRAWPEKICWKLSKAYYEVEGGHVHIFSEQRIQELIIKQHFSLTKKHWAHALHTPYWWLRCAHWNNGKDNIFSSLYHQLLVWDLLKKPWLTQTLDRCLNPFIGKSLVMYFEKR